MKSILWQTVLGEIELSVSRANFTAWFKNTELVKQDEEEIVVGVPNVFAKRQFEVKLNQQILETLERNGVKPKNLRFVVSSSATAKKQKAAVFEKEPTPDQTELQAAKPATKVATAAPSGLNPKYVFENFIVGSSNDLAYTACQAASKDPGTKYNPIFIYGGVGLGKTHLIQAVGNEVIRRQPDARVLYVSCETFVNEFLDHIRFKKKGFANRYRNVDVLIVDDLQFIAGKEKTQEEFFHTFNALHQANKQIILSSDKPPKAIPTLEERLRSRLEWGMAIDIKFPDFETRCAIIQTKASQSGIELPRDTVEYLAENFQTNIRELEGALNQLLANCEMRNLTPDLATTQALLGTIKTARPHHVSPRQIVERTARYFQLELVDISGARRDKHIVVPRQVAMYLLRSELHLSFPKIAVELGRQDHTTAIHSVEKIDKQMKLDSILRQQINDIRNRLYV